ncbi:uncharacterized protein [Dendrobates tinctorius]
MYPDWHSFTKATQSQIDSDVKQRWRSVRDRFNKFIASCQKSGASPTSRTFPYFQELQFLITSRTLRSTQGNIIENVNESEDGAGSCEAGDISAPCRNTTSDVAPSSSAAETSVSAADEPLGSSEACVATAFPVSGEPSKKRTKKKHIDTTLKASSDTLDLIKKTTSEDEFDFFGMTIANKIRSLTPERQSILMTMVQMSITALQDPAPIASYTNILMGVFNLFRPTPPTQQQRPTEYRPTNNTNYFSDSGSSQANYPYTPEYHYLP